MVNVIFCSLSPFALQSSQQGCRRPVLSADAPFYLRVIPGPESSLSIDGLLIRRKTARVFTSPSVILQQECIMHEGEGFPVKPLQLASASRPLPSIHIDVTSQPVDLLSSFTASRPASSARRFAVYPSGNLSPTRTGTQLFSTSLLCAIPGTCRVRLSLFLPTKTGVCNPQHVHSLGILPLNGFSSV